MSIQQPHMPQTWNLTFSNIFAQVDAFIKRCHDLLEISEARTHFARKDGNGRRPLPIFSGTKGSCRVQFVHIH